MSVIVEMEPRQHIENFLERLESDLCQDICVWGDVDKLVLSASPPNSSQMWRFLQVLRIQLLDIKEYLAKKDEELKPVPVAEEAPIIKKPRKERKKRETAEGVAPKKRQKKTVSPEANVDVVADVVN